MTSHNDTAIPEPSITDMPRPVLELGMALSTATRIEPALLRTMRLTVRPAFDVGVESDLWFGPWSLRAGGEYMAFRPAILGPLRQQLSHSLASAGPGDPLLRCRHVIETAHRSIAPILGLEEKVTWVAVLAEAGLADPGSTIDDLLGTALLAAQSQPDRRPGLLRWLTSAWNRLPGAVRASVTLTKLVTLLEEHERSTSTLSVGNSPAARPWAEGPPTHLLPVRHDGAYITLGDPTWPAAAIRVPDTQPLQLQVNSTNRWDDDEGFLSLRKGSVLTVPVSHVPVYLRTTHGTVYQLGTFGGPRELSTEPAPDVLLGTAISLLTDRDATSYGVKPVTAGISGQADSPAMTSYVRRKVDEELAAALDPAQAGNRLVIAKGRAGSGSTRTLWEAVRRCLPTWWLWAPTDPPGRGSLATTLSSRPLGTPLVIWLDEFDAYLHAPDGEQTAAALHRLLTDTDRGPVLIVGTRDPDDRSVRGFAAQELLDAATTIAVPWAFTAGELYKAMQQITNDSRLRRVLAPDMSTERSPVVESGLQGRIAQSLSGRLHTSGSKPQSAALPPLPALPAEFTGREDDLAAALELLTDPLKSAPALPKAVGIIGMPGVGKSVLALHTASWLERLGYFPGGILYNPGGPSSDAGAVLTGFIRALGLPSRDIPESVAQRRRLYHKLLAERSAAAGPVLVILDDVADREALEGLMPAPQVGVTLYTSRQHSLLKSAWQLHLDILTPNQAVALLEQKLTMFWPKDSRVHDEPNAAKEIVALCGYLPLALAVLAGRLIKERRTPLSAMIEKLNSGLLRTLDSGTTDMRAAFDVSYERLTVSQARTLRLLAANPGPDISTDAAVHLSGPAVAARSLYDLRALAAAGLVLRSAGHGGDRWSMHALVKRYILEVHADAAEQHAALLRLLTYYASGLEQVDAHVRTQPGSPDRHQAPDMQWFEAERANLLAAAQEADQQRLDQLVIRIAAGLAELLTITRRFDDLEHVASMAARAAESAKDPAALSDALNNQAVALYRNGRPEEALQLFRRAAQAYKGNSRPHARAVNNIGAGLLNASRFEEALAAFDQAAAYYADDPTARPLVQILSNRAHALQLLQRHEEAISTYHDAAGIAAQDNALQGELAAVLTNLGGAYRAANRPADAIEILQRAADLYTGLDDQYGLVLALSNLGNAYRHAGRSSDAITTLEMALTRLRDHNETPHLGQVLTNLASALMEADRFEEATRHLDQAVQVHTRTGDDQLLAHALNNLGLARFEIGGTGEAIRYLRRAQELHQRSGNLEGEAEVLFNIGNLQTRSHHYEEAFDALATALSLFRDIGDARGQAQTLNTLGITLLESGRHEDAVPALEESADLYTALGDHHATARALNNLGNALSSRGDGQRAIRVFQQAVQMLTAVGDIHNLAQTLTNLGNTQLRHGQIRQALANFAQAESLFVQLGDEQGAKRLRSTRNAAAHRSR